MNSYPQVKVVVQNFICATTISENQSVFISLMIKPNLILHMTIYNLYITHLSVAVHTTAEILIY